jgi:exosortase/archaeosortase
LALAPCTRRNPSIQALHISMPLVVAFSLLRVVVVNMGTQHIFVGVSRPLARAPTDGEPTPSREG